VRFWDSSALLPLFIAEPQTRRVRNWLRTDAGIMVWLLTRVEVLSAFARRKREQAQAFEVLTESRAAFLRAYQQWSEINEAESVRRHAERIVETYPLRAADALQLGAALVAAEDDSRSLDFVTLDIRLADAAEKEGFRVLGPG
jgi:predicted nucleic acid-binding protein